jgi:hypothetical protein
VKLFEVETPALLAKYLVAEHVAAISLATHCFATRIGDISITCNNRVFASIGGADWCWEDAPSNAPWGLLVRQRVASVALASPCLLRIRFEGGDFLEIETVEGPYESVIFDLPPRGDSIVMDIY